MVQWLFACGGVGFVGRPARVVAGGARLRLRSGAFAPDCPVLNLVWCGCAFHSGRVLG